jgi:hypothetical protein
MAGEDSTEELAPVLPARTEWEAFTVEAASMVEVEVAVMLEVAEAAVTTEQWNSAGRGDNGSGAPQERFAFRNAVLGVSPSPA